MFVKNLNNVCNKDEIKQNTQKMELYTNFFEVPENNLFLSLPFDILY